MAIDFTGHCRLARTDAQRRINFIRIQRPDWFDRVIDPTDARPPGPFDVKIGREFGVEVQSTLGLHVLRHGGA